MNTRKTVVGVMGSGAAATPEDCQMAYNLGKLIAGEGWVLLNGGRPAGVMEASARGAREKGGLTVGVLPGTGGDQASPYIDIAIVTGMGDARNNINVLSSDIIVALPGGAGTISEIALALKNGKRVILLKFDTGTLFNKYRDLKQLIIAGTPEEAVPIIKKELLLQAVKK
ncbi:TIGR00725 family protein [Desulfocucumis palustris]|nr:TIGR00725 family protein [Desulfocucumis palustris]